MKIGIDVSSIIYGTGVSEYTVNLVRHLIGLIEKTGDEVVLYGGSLRRYGELKRKVKQHFSVVPGGKVVTRIFPIPPVVADVIWNKLHVLPIEVLTGKVDVFHSSDWTQPLTEAFKVTTVHDLWPLVSPGSTDKKVVAVHRRRLNWVRREVDRVIVPSNATKREAIAMGIDEDKIRVIYEASTIEVGKRSKEEVERIKRKFGLKGKYLIGVGVGKRKNTDRIMAAFEKYRKDYQLVIIGRNQEGIKKTKGIVFTGHVDAVEFDVLLGGALALVYPSLHEGFGLPILEAFARGVVVVTSNVSAMAEVAGKAAVLVNPESVGDISQGIQLALKNRNQYVKKGKARMRKFSWGLSAEKTLKVYKERGK